MNQTKCGFEQKVALLTFLTLVISGGLTERKVGCGGEEGILAKSPKSRSAFFFEHKRRNTSSRVET
jgi:hypothetical protein